MMLISVFSSVLFSSAILMVVASVFFGCVGLKPASAEVVCTNKIQKVTKGVDCSIRVPLGTKAMYTCLGNLILSDSYNSTQCRFPGRWTPAPPKCIELPPVEATTLEVVDTTTKPLLLPIAAKTYNHMGLVSLYNESRTLKEAREMCSTISARLFYVDSVYAQTSAVDLLKSAQLNVTSDLLLEPVLDPTTHAYTTSWGLVVTPPVWCPNHPNLIKSCLAITWTARAPCTYTVPCGGNSLVMCREN